MKWKTKIIWLAVIFLTFGLIIGFLSGVIFGEVQAIRYGLAVVKPFVNFEFNEKTLAWAMWQYKNQIIHCYGGENALIHVDAWNQTTS